MHYYPQRKEGARAPLFDRLVEAVNGGFGETEPLHTLDRRQLEASIRREVGDLLNTRAPRPQEGADGTLTTLEYGLSDHTGRLTRDPKTWGLLSEDIRRGISAFEPRLREVQVEVSLDTEETGLLRASVHCGMIVDEVVEPVSFTFPLEGSSGSGAAFSRRKDPGKGSAS